MNYETVLTFAVGGLFAVGLFADNALLMIAGIACVGMVAIAELSRHTID